MYAYCYLLNLCRADEFVNQRAEAVRAAMRRAGAGDAELPAVLVENSSRCDTNEAGEAVLPTGVAWLPALMDQVRPRKSLRLRVLRPQGLCAPGAPQKSLAAPGFESAKPVCARCATEKFDILGF